MVDLTTQYLGLSLRNPLVPSASPLSKQLDTARALEDAGAGALVLHSLFEEKIEEEDANLARFFHQQSLGHAEAESFHPVPANYESYEEQYLAHVEAVKAALDIPVIASLNGVTPGGWTAYAKILEEAGADALELNVYYVAADAGESAEDVESRYLEILRAVRSQVSIPVAVKLSPHFSSLLNFSQSLCVAGANGLALFNRFYQPDIDLETLQVQPSLTLSSSTEALLRIRWLAVLHGRVDCSLAITGGVHTPEDVLKALLAGADVTHLCSALLQRGPAYLSELLASVHEWLEVHEYESVAQLKGSMSQRNAQEPAAFLRANYIDVLDNYQPPSGVRW